MAAVGEHPYYYYSLNNLTTASSPFSMSYTPPHGSSAHGRSSSSGAPFTSGFSTTPSSSVDPMGHVHSDHHQLPASVFGIPDYMFFDDQSAPPVSFGLPVVSAGAGSMSMASGSSGGSASNSRGHEMVERTERIAFRTQSEIEILEDGYKWRKYGKKSVKNSPNPRNYYRCSTEGCNVKKRVERDREDPSYVITTYEGVHNHVSPSTVYYASRDAASGRYFAAGMQLPQGS